MGIDWNPSQDGTKRPRRLRGNSSASRVGSSVALSTILCISFVINIRKKGCITLEKLGRGIRDSWVEVRPVHSADFKLLMKLSDIRVTQLNI
ncbi:hypothetical protein DPMN_041252 [Dreissena polymorpha]|uniref:Uncharacterized protein n=1 Tax=Dreissena polymorpha TaxID=45954 RepID=A0A9D4CWK2_DREPO|nr:hypothetical protein DPMN_041252 [Dreissena polymorpha]